MIYDRFMDKMFDKLDKANQQYAKMMYKPVGTLTELMRYDTEEHLRSVPADGWKPLAEGDNWGGEWQNMWVRGKVVVPAEAEGKKLYVLPKANAVEILYFLDGKPYGIINSKHGDFIGGKHAAQQITPCAKTGDTYEVALECYAGHYYPGTQPFDNYGADVINYDKNQFNRRFDGVELAILDEDIWHFVFDLKAVLQMARLPASDFLRNDAREVLEKVYAAIKQFPYDYPEEAWHPALVEAREIMKPLLERKGNEGTRGYVGLIGHSHMDTAWLWPVSETIRKCARTYANALHLMELYPEYKFVQSSALHLDWMRQYYPDIFEGIKQRTAEGRYEPNGGVWVECDCNITSGELMVRQFLRGQLFTRKYLNYTSDSFWLPDTFGYNAAIPQIMKGCGVDYFYTTKLGWGDLTSFPYDTFRWRGIDGTEVLTHFNQIHCFPDVSTTFAAVEHGIKNKTVYDGKLLSFGFGDGGGGPTPGMLEDARRVAEMPGVPKVEYTTVSDFMKDIEARGRDLPLYSGELYLECHRGTLTQMHDIKRNNRKAEFALRDMEYMNTLVRAPKNVLSDDLYGTLLKNQFHDILPGTSIQRVNDLARKEVTEVIASANAEADKYETALTDGDTGSVTVFNTLSFDRCDEVALDSFLEGKAGQKVTDVCGRELYVSDVGCIPAFGAASFKRAEAPCSCSEKSVFAYDGKTLDTPLLKAEFDENGFISSLYDKKARRQVVRDAAKPLGIFHIADDVPQSWDNWDLDYDLKLKYRQDAKLLSREVVADGALQFRLRSKYAIGQRSTLTQDMIFHAKSAKIDYHTLIDWQEKHTILKAGFDVNILAPTVKNEIQFGHIDRPTSENFDIEAAKFEVCNHKWSDLSENRYGVAVLNDCKYGISVKGSDMRLTLHRGGCRPDTTGDAGLHEMTYSLLPHEGIMTAESVIRPAYELNIPCRSIAGMLKTEITPVAKVDAPNVIVESVKPAELRENAYVLRMYEAERSAVSTEVALPADVKRAYLTNMLEDVKEELAVVDGRISLDFGPFQIITVMLEV